MAKRIAGSGLVLWWLLAAGCTGDATCNTNADCSDGKVCSAAGVCSDPQVSVGEGEGEGEGEVEPRSLRVQVGPGRSRLQSARFTLTGGLVGSTAPLVVRGSRFTLRPMVGSADGGN